MSTLTGATEVGCNMDTEHPTCCSKKMVWTGRILSTLVVLFMVMDGVMKLMQPAPVMQATARLGFPNGAITGIGIVLLACTIFYSIPRTAVFGAILLTGYLGGAVATQVRAGSSLFETLFPVIFGVLVWGGLFLRDKRLRALIPWRRNDLGTQKTSS
jgi:DoxX-like family